MTYEEALKIIENDRLMFSEYESIERDEAYRLAMEALEKQIMKENLQEPCYNSDFVPTCTNKEFYYIAYNDENPEYVCLITSIVELTPKNFKGIKPFLKFSSTNWGGCDKRSRALELFNLKSQNKIIQLNERHYYSGEDYDCGHKYPFKFEFNTLELCIKLLRRH